MSKMKKNQPENNANKKIGDILSKIWKKHGKTISFLLVVIVPVLLAVAYVSVSSNKHELLRCEHYLSECEGVVENSKRVDFFGNIGSHLEHVVNVLARLGFKHAPNSTDWDLFWAHDYPFKKLYPKMRQLKPHQKVNHFPGCGYITNKVDLAISGLKYIPPAFKLPEDKEKLLDYAKTNPNATFVQKNNEHRHIKVKKIEAIDFDWEGTFIQEYVQKPLLINGHKFDIGIYTIITSIEPLRIYVFNGEALLRFCPLKYYPFNPHILDKYVVGDDYLPIWKVPGIDFYYNELGFSMKESLNGYLQSKGKDGSKIWEQIEDSIRISISSKEQLILEATKKFKSRHNFFEMMRFDFILDEDLNVYLLEANMSPNLSSAHFKQNQLIYEQVLYNLFSLVGVGEIIRKGSLVYRSKEEEMMIVADKDLMVYPDTCSSEVCRNSCVSPDCLLCKPCMSYETRQHLVQAYKEHVNRGNCKRIFPEPMTKESALKPIDYEDYSAENQLQIRWFQGKCLLDPSWC